MDDNFDKNSFSGETISDFSNESETKDKESASELKKTESEIVPKDSLKRNLTDEQIESNISQSPKKKIFKDTSDQSFSDPNSKCNISSTTLNETAESTSKEVYKMYKQMNIKRSPRTTASSKKTQSTKSSSKISRTPVKSEVSFMLNGIIHKLEVSPNFNQPSETKTKLQMPAVSNASREFSRAFKKLSRSVQNSGKNLFYESLFRKSVSDNIKSSCDQIPEPQNENANIDSRILADVQLKLLGKEIKNISVPDYLVKSLEVPARSECGSVYNAKYRKAKGIDSEKRTEQSNEGIKSHQKPVLKIDYKYSHDKERFIFRLISDQHEDNESKNLTNFENTSEIKIEKVCSLEETFKNNEDFSILPHEFCEALQTSVDPLLETDELSVLNSSTEAQADENSLPDQSLEDFQNILDSYEEELHNGGKSVSNNSQSNSISDILESNYDSISTEISNVCPETGMRINILDELNSLVKLNLKQSQADKTCESNDSPRRLLTSNVSRKIDPVIKCNESDESYKNLNNFQHGTLLSTESQSITSNIPMVKLPSMRDHFELIQVDLPTHQDSFVEISTESTTQICTADSSTECSEPFSPDLASTIDVSIHNITRQIQVLHGQIDFFNDQFSVLDLSVLEIPKWRKRIISTNDIEKAENFSKIRDDLVEILHQSTRCLDDIIEELRDLRAHKEVLNIIDHLLNRIQHFINKIIKLSDVFSNKQCNVSDPCGKYVGTLKESFMKINDVLDKVHYELDIIKEVYFIENI